MASQQQSLGAMVKGVTEDLSTLVRGEIELAKTELAASAKTAANGGALLAVAGVVALYGVLFILLTLAYVLAQLGLPVWAAFGIVALLLVIVAVVLGLLGRKRLEQVTGPERTAASIEKTKAVLSRQPLAAAPAAPAAATAPVTPASTSAAPAPTSATSSAAARSATPPADRP